jgi:hypothetical protein
LRRGALRLVGSGLSRFRGELFTQLVRVGGMFVGLFGQLVSVEVVPFIVSDCGSSVGVGCKVVKLCDSIV